MGSIVVFCENVLDISQISELSIDYFFELDLDSRKKIMLSVHFLDFEEQVSKKDCFICNLFCIGVVAF